MYTHNAYHESRDLGIRGRIFAPSSVVFGEYPMQLDVTTSTNWHTIYRVNAYFRGNEEQEIGVYHRFADFIDDIPGALSRISTTSKRRPSGILISGNLGVNEREEIADRLTGAGVTVVSFIPFNNRFIFG